MSLSRPFIDRPRATNLLAVALFCGGIFGYRALPVAPLPKLEFPTLSLSVGLPGASPETIAASVAAPLERSLGRIAGLTELTSQSGLGQTQLTLQFDLARNIDAAARDVEGAVNAAQGDLPQNLPSLPTLRRINPSDAPIVILGLSSPFATPGVLYDLAQNVLAQKLGGISGVGQVMVGGGQQPAVRIQVDSQALAARGLSLDAVRIKLAAANALMPLGTRANQRSQVVFRTDDQIDELSEYRALVLAVDGPMVTRLGDVASISWGEENARTAAWVDGRRSVILVVRKEADANVLATIERIKAAHAQIKNLLPAGAQLEIALDRSSSVRTSIREVELTLLATIGLVGLVVWIFLRDIRQTLIPSLAVPLSLAATFFVMRLCHFSLDNLSLLALTIATGFVVDDAIVVTENIARHLAAGMNAYKAALMGSRQVGFTVLSMTASLLAVFLPLLLMDGLVGRLFFEFAAVLSIAIVMSALVALSVTPAWSAQYLRPHSANPSTEFLGRGLDAMARGYAIALRYALRYRRMMLALTLGCILMTAGLAAKLPKGLFPQTDTGLMVGFVEAAENTSFLSLRYHLEKAMSRVRADPDVSSLVAMVGSQNGGPTNTGQMFISLRPWGVRKTPIEQIIRRLRKALAEEKDLEIYLQPVQDLRIGGRTGRSLYQYTASSADLLSLRKASQKILTALREMPELRDVSSDHDRETGSVFLFFDRERAASLGVTVQNIDNELYDAFGQRQIGLVMRLSNQSRIIITAGEEARQDIKDITRLYVLNKSGQPVALSEIVDAKIQSSPPAINHQAQLPSVTFSFNLGPKTALGDVTARIENKIAALDLPRGVTAGFAGTAQAAQDQARSAFVLLSLALGLVYVVLGLLYESFIHPLTILSTLPSAALGALLGLKMCGLELDIMGVIGLLLLVGIVKKNAILLVDFALQERKIPGVDDVTAISRACQHRFRPILMTTLAALFGALPLAFGTGGGAALRRPLGVTIVGGLALSQVITLFTVPVIFLAFCRLERRGQNQKK